MIPRKLQHQMHEKRGSTENYLIFYENGQHKHALNVIFAKFLVNLKNDLNLENENMKNTNMNGGKNILLKNSFFILLRKALSLNMH